MRALILAIFFASGTAALLYQTIWQRMLALFLGADVYSATIIVGAFMAGLGFGHLAGGHLADRLPPRPRILAFAGAEIAVAAFAAVSAWIFYDVLYQQVGGLDWPRSAVAAVTFAVTLWPTFFMGLSLPLLSRVLELEAHQSPRWIASLYGWNTLGAAFGSFVSIAVLFRLFDMRTSVRIGAVVSLCCGLGALILAPRLSLAGNSATLKGSRLQGSEAPVEGRAPLKGSCLQGDDVSRLQESTRAPDRYTHLPLALWLAVYALSGFVALSLEIVWFRVFAVILKANAFTFGYLLAIYLGGIGLGSLLVRHPRVARLPPASAFFGLQAAIPATAAGLLALLIHTVDRVPAAELLWRFLESPSPIGGSGTSLRVALLVWGFVPPILILPSTLMMGLAFGLLQRAVQNDPGVVGRRLGWLQAANILGSTFGALATGLVLLGWLGSSGTLRFLVVCGGVLLGIGVLTRSVNRRGMTAALASLVIAAGVSLPVSDTFWGRLHGSTADRVIAAEDASGAVLLRQRDDGGTDVFLSGISQSWLPYGGPHTALGVVPALIHPSPKRIAVIGLASGDTAYSIAGRGDTEVVDSIEIVRPQLDVLRRLDARAEYPALRMLLNDNRIRHHVGDGRAFLRKTSTRYDIIEADAMLPVHAGAGNLYSVEYFELLRDRLTPGGLAVTWAPTERIRASLLYVFPHVLMFPTIAIGSMTPISFDRDVVLARLSDPHVRQYYARGQVDVLAVVSHALRLPPVVYGPSFDRTTITDLNRDLFPQDEFRRRIRTRRFQAPSDPIQDS